ncbi:MAG TPA: radical SAM family heme chaperone HemW [Candidatus Dormibacteraeota bacterium]|nr:radical SAM family heme chaperone HemW [Candidatus Dormibacteraeota bacterium]
MSDPAQKAFRNPGRKLGVYVQVPFCQAKCSYCNFSTGVFSPHIHGPYVDALCREIRGHAGLYRDAGLAGWNPAPRYEIDTLYVGGGTPSLLDPAYLAKIVEAVRETFPGAIEEATLEADPETVTEDRARAWRKAGFNRISLGAQSFHDDELKAVGRRHRRADIFTAARLLAAARFDNVSFDLIAGLPHQTTASWQASVGELLRLEPVHISIYILEIDQGSRLGRESLAGGRRYGAGLLPDDDQMADFYEWACARLSDAGYHHYEISNWAIPGFPSRHNLKYWRREPYLGFGAGAHSFDGHERWANAHDPAAYIAAIQQGRLAPEGREAVDSRQALEEELFLGLRQLDGIDLKAIEDRYGVQLAERVDPLAAEGLVEMTGGRLRLAPSRLAVSNEVFVRLLD